MVKRLITLGLLLIFSAPVLADTGLHLVMLKGKGVTPKFENQVNSLGGEITFSHQGTKIAFVSGLDAKAAAKLSSFRNVQRIMADGALLMDPAVVNAGAESVDLGLASPDDPSTASRYSWQWNMPAVDADLAWANGRLGSPNVTVAILDTGIAYTHADLAGLVDLSRSVSFLPDDDALVDAFFPGMHHITDLHYHGTHVASTVASNGLATAGVTSKTTLMGVKVCSVFGGCPFSAVIGGVLHAADNGADVANLSLGGSFPKNGRNGFFVGFINRVFNYANSVGMTVVVSAGNSAADLDHDKNSYKSYCSTPNTICVSATGPTFSDDFFEGPFYDVDALAGYSNYGRSAINVAAPGGNWNAVWASCSSTSLVIPICQTGTFILGLGGTSMAAPHVSGTAALVVEDLGRDPGAVRSHIQDTADDLGQPGTDPAYGKGRLNVNNASQ